MGPRWLRFSVTLHGSADWAEGCYDGHFTMIKRNETREVRVGSVTLGAGHDVAVQSMCATRTRDVDATVEQAEAIREAGGTLIRVAVDSAADVEALFEVRRQTRANLVVDLQESYRLAEKVACLLFTACWGIISRPILNMPRLSRPLFPGRPA